MTTDRRARLGSRLRVALFSLLASLVLAEAAAQWWIVHYASAEQFTKYASLGQALERNESINMFARHPYLGFYPRPEYAAGDNEHNSLGYRGAEFPREKPEGEFRIACLGGSTTYGSGLADWRLAYPARLEAELARRGHERIRVVNAGCNSWTTHESLVNLHERVLDLSPDLILVLHSVNDVHARLVWPAEHYVGDNSGFRTVTSGLVIPSFLEYSALWRLIAVSEGWMQSHAALETTFTKDSEWSVARLFGRQVNRGVYPKLLFRSVPVSAILEANPPLYYRRNLTEMARCARARGIGCVLVSFVYYPGDPRTLSGTPEYQRAYAEHEAVMREVAANEGAHYFDLRALFPAEKRYFGDGMHRNAEGTAIEAGLFADYLEREGLLPH